MIKNSIGFLIGEAHGITLIDSLLVSCTCMAESQVESTRVPFFYIAKPVLEWSEYYGK